MFKRCLFKWSDRYFYRPNFFDIIVSMILSPLSLLYSIAVIIKKSNSCKIDFNIPIISVGNLVVGGSGKTPLVKAIYNSFYDEISHIFIISRGYKRASKGLIEVAIGGKILCSIKDSGDEAMEYATTLKGANIIVCEDRKIAINRAKDLGARLVILDDGFSKFDIAKFDILLKPSISPRLNITLPSGAYRYPLHFYKYANLIPQDSDIIKKSYIKDKSDRMVLVSAIANPIRLKEHFDKCVGGEFFIDHYSFSKSELEKIIAKYSATSLLMTRKDYVKVKDFNLPVSIIELETKISQSFKDRLNEFIVKGHI